MELFHALGPQVGMVAGLLSFAAELIVGYWLLRHFKIIRRREYDRLKGTEAAHQRCVAEWGRLCTAADQELENQVEAEFDAREPVMSRR